MAASNESQGLKIAVAAFITLTVILLVSTYFIYSAYASADAQKTAANEEASKAKAAQSVLLKQYEEMKQKIGVKGEEYEQAKEEITVHLKKVDDRLNALNTAVNAAVAKAVAAGASGAELEEAKNRIQQAVSSFHGDQGKSYISSVDRLAEVLENLSMVATELSVDYAGVRQNLEGATNVAKQQVDVQSKAAMDSRSDLEAEHKKHEEERQSLITKVDQLQTDNDKKSTEIASQATKLKQQEEDLNRKIELQTTIIRELRDKSEQKETILDRPDGYVTYVDYEQHQVLVNVTKRQGARPQQKMTIFDAASPGIPTEKPKATIELIKVGDQSSSARIVSTVSSTDPIRVGDIVYSPSWSPNTPMRFALIGKMDVNRDDRDDRQELKRMIEESGGVVDYDLPPLDIGKESGALSPRIDWYVIDDRIPLRERFAQKSKESGARASELEKKMGEKIKEARLNGIRPLMIGKLLAYLGYDYNVPVGGRSEAVNVEALRRITAPRRQQGPAAAKTAAPDAAAKSDEMKDEPKPDAAETKKAGDDEPK